MNPGLSECPVGAVDTFLWAMHVRTSKEMDRVLLIARETCLPELEGAKSEAPEGGFIRVDRPTRACLGQFVADPLRHVQPDVIVEPPHGQ